jgi:protein-L-isoaspartate(D-aspartate) O-methyltransferase
MLEYERKNLVEKLKKQGRITSEKVEKAFLKVPRENFIPANLESKAYYDTPLEIGNDQTISAPHMVAIMAEEVDLREGHKVLEIGAGSGYHAAIISRIIGEKGHVYSIERIKSLADKAKNNLEKTGIKNVTIEIGDGSEGLSKYAPYDRVYVTCASPGVPDPLIDQLKRPGKLLIPVGSRLCELKLIEKNEEGDIKSINLGGCAFVPLVGKHGF